MVAAAWFSHIALIKKNDIISTTYYNLGVSLEQSPDKNQAISYYQKALSLNPKHTMAHNNLGILLFHKGEIQKAMEHFKEAIRLKADIPDPYHNLGLAYSGLGMLREALESFNKVIALDPNYNPVVYYNIACIQARLDQSEAAIDSLKKAILHGYHNWEQLGNDPDLANIRGMAEFQRLTKK